ncbi:hypothetical protein EOD41_12800 [Mucilaginibacter limnophilus]|uniref:Chemotaxis methyl-accepting receptor HlyB-like 4HB MCP domain-containing protein n=1 Tax=Mucilaginibacter limnophilus TaxID=1932778 RepID=A0A3S2VLV5_9SPHI|nr:MCP four helix bundle domain-containing protein [Mucilaginibacter limnophilus]RVU00353.1 hypothetical protein EOD41_12800 [Mucilaginibacter limnophilus]
MKWTLFIQQKMKVAMLLFCVMFFVLLTGILGSKNLNSMNRSVNTIYNDRLIPAADVYYISHHLHNKMALLNDMLGKNNVDVNTVNQLKAIHNKISGLLSDFENTYLVKGETASIANFKHSYSTYNHAEATALGLIKSGEASAARLVYDNELKQAHKGSLKVLDQLINIQSNVGKDIIKQSEFNANVFNLLSKLQIVVAIVIGVLITRLVMSSRIANIPAENYKLN